MQDYWVHNIDPVMLSIGFLQIRWYGLAYAIGLIFAWQYGMRLAAGKQTSVTPKQVDRFLIFAVAGVIIGGRLGQVLFYYPDYYFAHPAEIFKVWQGGMSFHGGLLGVLIALLLYCHRHRINPLALGDIIAVGAPFGIMCGRIANFINGEHAGRITDIGFAVIFPHISNDPRHPSQLYEAALEGLIPFIILLILIHRFHALKRVGFISGMFLILYALGRIIAEQFREPEIIGLGLPAFITFGSLLSIPMLVAGMWIILRPKKA